MNLASVRERSGDLSLGICILGLSALALGAVTASHHFMAGEKAKVKGIIQAREGDAIKLRHPAKQLLPREQFRICGACLALLWRIAVADSSLDSRRLSCSYS